MAVKLGIENVEGRILKGLTAKQFRRWEQYAELEPFDEVRADYRAASIVAALFNVNRGKGQKAMTLDEAVVKFGQSEPKPKQTPEQQLAVLKLLAAIHSTDEGDGKLTPEQEAQDAELAAGMRDQIAKARAAMIGMKQEQT